MALNDIYKSRLNRWGTNSTDRLNNARAVNFQRFLEGSPHTVEFLHEGETQRGVLEPFRQDQSKTLMHLLTDIEFQPKIGTIVEIEGFNWMFYWLDDHRNKGYNRWIVMKMSREVEWRNPNGDKHSSLAFIYGQEDNMLKNEIRSRSRSAALYQENLKLSFMVMPAKGNIEYDSYLTIEESGFSTGFRVTGYDFLSTPGIVYVSMDPTPARTDFEKEPEVSSDPSNPWLGGFLDD